MTVKNALGAKKASIIYTTAFIISISITLILALFMSGVLSEGVRGGLLLSWRVVIPSVFPFMILSDVMAYVFDKMNEQSSIISPGAKICLIGFLCGFPCGAKRASEAYERGEITGEAATLYAAVASVPSPAFIVGGVKSALGFSVKEATVSIISVMLSGILFSAIFKEKSKGNAISCVRRRHKYSFVASVKDAGLACVTVCSFVTLFFTISKVLGFFGLSGTALSTILPFLEVSSALNSISTATEIPYSVRLTCVGFSLGFGGISALLQGGVYLEKQDLSVIKFIAIKLSIGIFTAVVFALFIRIFK